MAIRFGDLKEAYVAATRRKEADFEIDGVKLATGYAKYLVQYLEMKGLRDENIITLEQGKWEGSEPLSNING